MKIFCVKVLIFFLFLLQNIDCRYSLVPPWHFSYFYPKDRLWVHVRTASPSTHNLSSGAKKKKKKIGLPPQTPVSYRKVGFKGVLIARTCFPDAYFFKTFRQEAKTENTIDAKRHPNTHKYGLLHIYEPSFFLSFLHVVKTISKVKYEINAGNFNSFMASH